MGLGGGCNQWHELGWGIEGDLVFFFAVGGADENMVTAEQGLKIGQYNNAFDQVFRSPSQSVGLLNIVRSRVDENDLGDAHVFTCPTNGSDIAGVLGFDGDDVDVVEIKCCGVLQHVHGVIGQFVRIVNNLSVGLCSNNGHKIA